MEWLTILLLFVLPAAVLIGAFWRAEVQLRRERRDWERQQRAQRRQMHRPHSHQRRR